MNIAQNIERATRHFPDAPAICFEGQTISYRALSAALDRTAHGLVALRVAPGDRGEFATRTRRRSRWPCQGRTKRGH